MSYVSIVSIIVMIFQIVFVISLFLYSRKQKVIISKNTIFWFVPVFIFLFILYLTGYVYNMQSIGVVGFIESIVASLKSFAFEINTNHISSLLQNDVLYAISFYVSYSLAVITILASAIGLLKEYILNTLRVVRTKRNETDVLIGFSKSALEYALVNRGRCIIWINNAISLDQKRIIEQEKIPYIKSNLSLDTIKKLSKRIRYNFILFEGQEDQYQYLIDLFVEANKEYKNIHLYLEVRYQEMSVVREQYLNYRKDNPNLFIKTFSKYELISRKFVTEHTIPKFLKPEDFNENRSIKNEKDINVFFIGFGKINASLFPMFCQNNQLVTMVDNRLKAKLVNYYMIDQNTHAVDDKRIDNLLSNYSEMASDLPLPENLCTYHKIIGNINSNDVIEKIKVIASNKDSLNIFIVSFGNDYENIEMASWLKDQFNNENSIISCRVKNARVIDKEIISFGNEKEILHHSYIIDEKLQKLAKDINSEYHKATDKQEKYWNNLNQIELFSNYYSAMNIEFKLNILGLTLTEEPNCESISRDEFMKIYNKNSPSVHSYSDYFGATVRNVIAYGEKLRWNAFYLFNGYKPMLLDEVEVYSDKKYLRKNADKKVHACLTSHIGLDLLHKKVIQKMKDKKIEATLDEVETFSYDYMAFDNPKYNLFDTLVNQGYKIVKLEKKK